jgi:preprotein translocase SecE subunit
VPVPVDDVPAPETLEQADLIVGAPPEDLGAVTPLPPDDEPLDDELVDDDLVDADPLDDELGVEELSDDELADADAAVARPAPVAVAGAAAAADELDAEDELLPAARNAKGRPKAKSGGNRAIAFLQASWAELQRVQWPNRRQVGQATAVVLGFVVIAGGYLGLADLVSQKIVDTIL